MSSNPVHGEVYSIQHYVIKLDKLRVPDKFNLDARNLADAWKRVKLFLYLIGTRGREIYETMTFANAPKNRTLLMVTEAFDNYCNPKKK